MDGSMGRWMDEWTGVRSQLTCVILESQKTIQHLLTLHTLSLLHTKHHCLFTKEQKGNRRVFFVKPLEIREKKSPSINLSGFWGGFFSMQLVSCATFSCLNSYILSIHLPNVSKCEF